MNSGPESSSGLDSSSPLELALDRAMDRCWAAEQVQRAQQRRASRRAPTTALVVSSGASDETVPLVPANDTARVVSTGPSNETALVVPANETALALPPARLRWRGIEVSDEFQEYAARVACGEQLAPYRGPVLARPCADFPWGQTPQLRQRAETPLFARSTKITAMLLSAGAALLAAIGVGSGAASPVEGDLDGLTDQSSNALRPAPILADETSLASLHASEDVPAADAARKPPARRAARSTPRRSRPGLPSPSATATPDAVASAASDAAASASLDATTTPAAADAETSDPFGLDAAYGARSMGAAATTASAATASGPAPTPKALSKNGSSPASTRVGTPSDWDPTGKMSILFSDDPTF